VVGKIVLRAVGRGLADILVGGAGVVDLDQIADVVVEVGAAKLYLLVPKRLLEAEIVSEAGFRL
jgi:hypothetical protein